MAAAWVDESEYERQRRENIEANARLLLSLGLVSVLLIVAITLRMDAVDREIYPVHVPRTPNNAGHVLLTSSAL